MIHFPKINAILFSFMLMLACTSIHAQTGEIRGRVIDEKGNGLMDVTVSVLDSIGRSTDKFTYTDSNGNYDLKKLANEQHNFKFYKEGFSTHIVNKVPFKTDTIVIQNIKLKVKLKDVKNAEIKYLGYGRGQSGEIRGRVTSRNNKALKGVTISLLDSSGKEINYSVKSNDDGTYKLNHLFPGIYNVKYSGDGLLPKIINGIPVKADTFVIQNIMLTQPTKVY